MFNINDSENTKTNLIISIISLLALTLVLATLSICLYIKINELNDKNIKLSKQVNLLVDKTDELYVKCTKLELNNKKNQKSSTNNDCFNRLENIDLESLIESVAFNTQAIQKVYTLVLSLRFFHSKYDEQKLDISDAEYIQILKNLDH